MQNRLKWLVILLTLCAVFLLCACGDTLSQVLQLRGIPMYLSGL